MEVIQQRSTLNPNAPLFVPLAYRTVEDFSDQWWALVQSSPWFRDYWLQERFQDPQNDPSFSDFYDPALLDLDALLEEVEEEVEEYYRTREEFEEEEEEKREWHRELVPIGALKWQKGRALAEAPKYAQKAPKIVNVKVSPRTIQQPK